MLILLKNQIDIDNVIKTAGILPIWWKTQTINRSIKTILETFIRQHSQLIIVTLKQIIV